MALCPKSFLLIQAACAPFTQNFVLPYDTLLHPYVSLHAPDRRLYVSDVGYMLVMFMIVMLVPTSAFSHGHVSNVFV